MSDDSFTHDADRFDPAAAPDGVVIADAEARYAELCASMLWNGALTADRRRELAAAARGWGISDARADQIEQALLMAQQVPQHYEVADEDTNDLEKDAAPHTVAPLAISQDPRLLALQRRIELLEQQNHELERAYDKRTQRITALQGLVEQLQYALESTLDELDRTHRELEKRPRAEAAPTVRGTLSRSEPPPPPPPPPPLESEKRPSAAPPSMVAQRAPSPDHSVAQMRTGAYDDSASWDHEALVAGGQPARRDNPAELHARLRATPRDAQALRALFRALGRGEDLDRRWCIAHVLVFLGHAEDEERELHDAHARAGLVRPVRAVNDDEWRELLFHPDEDLLIGEILSAIAPAVLLGHVTSIRASIAPEVLEPATRVDPKSSTLQAVRCIAWAADFLGLKLPSLHVCPDFAGTADVVLNPTPCTRLGKLALRDRSTQELAFIAGRHLSWYRREHLLGKPQRSTRRLEDMFLAALMIGNPGLPMTPEIKKRVEPIARAIRPLLDGPAVEKLQHGFSRFVELGGRANLSRWFGSAEKTAACAGLLLANDLHAANAMLELEDRNGAKAALDELIVFFTAGRCSLLRKRIGIAVS
jgi:hypothetical protein